MAKKRKTRKRVTGRGPRGLRGKTGRRGPRGHGSSDHAEVVKLSTQMRDVLAELQVQLKRIAQIQAQLDRVAVTVPPDRVERRATPRTSH
jgi:hypothetical protein